MAVAIARYARARLLGAAQLLPLNLAPHMSTAAFGARPPFAIAFVNNRNRALSGSSCMCSAASGFAQKVPSASAAEIVSVGNADLRVRWAKRSGPPRATAHFTATTS
jgi:hypothetical protein